MDCHALTDYHPSEMAPWDRGVIRSAADSASADSGSLHAAAVDYLRPSRPARPDGTFTTHRDEQTLTPSQLRLAHRSPVSPGW